MTDNANKLHFPWYAKALILIGYLIDLLIVWPIQLAFFLLFKIPAVSTPLWRLLGAVRMVSIIAFLHYASSEAPHDTVTRYIEFKLWMSGMTETSYDLWDTILLLPGLVLALNVFMSLIVTCGFCKSYDGYTGNVGATGYSNIDEALDYQHAVANMQSTRGKVDEYGKTAFKTKEDFRAMAQNPNMKEAFGYLNSKLGMQSTSGKLATLQNLFGNK